MPKSLLHVDNVTFTLYQKTGFLHKKRQLRVLDNVSFAIMESEIIGLVGESGCGKSTLARAILHLEPISKGKIRYQGVDTSALKKKKLIEFRRNVQIIFQDAFSSLNE